MTITGMKEFENVIHNEAVKYFRTCPHRIKIYAKACGYAK